MDSPRRSSTTWNAWTALTNVARHVPVIVNATWSTNARIALNDARVTSNGWYALTTIDASRTALDDARPASTTNATWLALNDAWSTAHVCSLIDAYVAANAVTRNGNAWLTYGWHASTIIDAHAATDAYAVTYEPTSNAPAANAYAIARYAHGTTLDVVLTTWHAARYVTNATSDGRHASTKHDGHAVT